MSAGDKRRMAVRCNEAALKNRMYNQISSTKY
jgi:hypothetical protein